MRDVVANQERLVPKNIVLLCEGTDQGLGYFFGRGDSNILRLYQICRDGDKSQSVFYQPGIGYMENLIRRPLAVTLGYQIHRLIASCYEFLMERYVDGDRVFLFGFSRGAYVVRAVASLLHLYGLLVHQQTNFVYPLIAQTKGLRALAGEQRLARMDVLKYWFAPMMRPCRPWFVGVWDTVISIQQRSFVFILNNPSIHFGRHALALDERRAIFEPVLWHPDDAKGEPSGPKDLQQVWFPGAHSDVGGGYHHDSILSDITLDWMLQEAKRCGLSANQSIEDKFLGHVKDRRDLQAALLHRSMTKRWYLGEFAPLPRYDWREHLVKVRPNMFRRRQLPAGSLVHESAFMLGDEYMRGIPPDAIRVGTIRGS